MPAVQYDYDGYDYIVKKRTPTKRTTATTTNSASRASSKGYAPNSNVKSRNATSRINSSNKSSNHVTTAKTSSTRRTSTSTITNRKTTSASTTRGVKTTTSNKKKSSLEAVKKVNRASVRTIMADNAVDSAKKKSTATKRKNNNKSLDVPDMLKAKNAKPKEMSLKHAEKMVAPKKKAKSVEKKKESVIKTMALSLFAFSILFLICYRSSAINESFNVLGNIKSDLENVNTINAQLASDIETQTDISTIETYAKYQLGMQKPKDSQIKKIVVNKEDKISTPVVIETEEDSMAYRLWHDILNALD